MLVLFVFLAVQTFVLGIIIGGSSLSCSLAVFSFVTGTKSVLNLNQVGILQTTNSGGH